MATGETFKMSIIGALADGTAIVNDFGYVDLSSGSTHLDTGTMAGDFATFCQAEFLQCMGTDYHIAAYRAACVSGTHVGEIGYSEVEPVQPGLLDPAGRYPNEICISLKRNTGHASRRDRGRIFLGPVCSEFIDPAHTDRVVDPDGYLLAMANKLKGIFNGDGHNLSPVILAADGTYSGRIVVNTSIGEEFVHHKSRRLRIGA